VRWLSAAAGGIFCFALTQDRAESRDYRAAALPCTSSFGESRADASGKTVRAQAIKRRGTMRKKSTGEGVRRRFARLCERFRGEAAPPVASPGANWRLPVKRTWLVKQAYRLWLLVP
jgi:hypothetical protein